MRGPVNTRNLPQKQDVANVSRSPRSNADAPILRNPFSYSRVSENESEQEPLQPRSNYAEVGLLTHIAHDFSRLSVHAKPPVTVQKN